MQDLDKGAMGKRIRQIRLAASLRQWELAKLLGTTQSAVHKYEHGVVPEPRRLVELAKIGGTSIEWVLTGTHWENGSREQQRVAPECLKVAAALMDVESEDLSAIRVSTEMVLSATSQELKDNGYTGHPGNIHAESHRVRDAIRIVQAAARKFLSQRFPLSEPLARVVYPDSSTAGSSGGE